MTYVDELQSELASVIPDHAVVSVSRDEIPPFRTFAPAREPREMIAVDGSYNFLLNLSSWWLALVSVGMLRYSCRDDAYRREDHRLWQRVYGVSTWPEAVAKQDDVHRALFEFTRNATDQHRAIVNEYRRLIEGQLAVNVADNVSGRIVAVDGALAEFPKPFEFMARLVRVCETQDHMLVGVSKDSSIHAFGRALTDEEFLRRCQVHLDGDAVAFVRAPPDFERKQKGLLHGDVYFVRFHTRSPKWFRVDLGTHRDDPERVFGEIAPYCRSLVSLGYPMPLLEAHRMAVTVRQLRDVYRGIVIRAAVSMGMNIRQVLDGLTEIEGRRRSAFHEYLDRVARDLR